MAGSVAADLGLAGNQNQRWSRPTGAVSESVQQAENAGVSQRNSQKHGSSHGEGDHKGD